MKAIIECYFMALLRYHDKMEQCKDPSMRQLREFQLSPLN